VIGHEVRLSHGQNKHVDHLVPAAKLTV
jgi:hypothetical protein